MNTVPPEGAISATLQLTIFALHDAAERGDAELLRLLLQAIKQQQEASAASDDQIDSGEIDVNDTDEDKLTPLHLALLNGHYECVEALLGAGADINASCEGSPPLHVAVCMGAFVEHQAFAESVVKLLLQHGASPYERDEQQRTALHWAAVYGLSGLAAVLIEAATAVYESERARLSSAIGNDAEAVSDLAAMPHIIELADDDDNNALHLAARHAQPQTLQMCLDALKHSSAPASVSNVLMARNGAAQLPLHMAALAGDGRCAALLYSACADAAAVADGGGFVASQLAARRGHDVLAKALSSGDMTIAQHAAPAARSTTAVLAPRLCMQHFTCADPPPRGCIDVPPENSNRLRVLVSPGRGILRCAAYDDVQLHEGERSACMADVLRVHAWSYISKIRAACAALPDTPTAVGHLDSDTTISHRSFAASLAAAGAVCEAVDKVMNGEARNVFCAVRPPGHHAGPHGVVKCANDPHGSHGFCLLNNIAIAAAYAMNVYRHAGVRRVAVLDFDVHHGNGTQACVENTTPSVLQSHYETPYGSGTIQFPQWQPWLDSSDSENVFFASVQGYGHKLGGGYVYPGSGATCDNRVFANSTAQPSDAAAAAAAVPQSDTEMHDGDASHGAEESLEEDPNGEFVYHSGDVPRLDGPRIVNVGIPGPGSKASMWRRAWRDKILPALVKFHPDIIFISAGFDAHKKDALNCRFVGVQERDYEWLTDAIVQVANRCCEGRIVSALEGGYSIAGGVVSAFARSVAAHVTALKDCNLQLWDAEDPKRERAEERRKRQERMELKAMRREQRAAAQHAAASDVADAAPVPPQANGMATPDQQPPADVNAIAMDSTAAAAATEEGVGEVRRVRRRRASGAADYVALNEAMDAAAAATAATAAATTAAPSMPAAAVAAAVGGSGGDGDNDDLVFDDADVDDGSGEELELDE